MKVNIGIDQACREKIADALKYVLADTYTLYLKTHNFHWNVTGPHFASLHVLWESHYQELAVAVDDIAERIRALGCPAPGSYKQFGELSSIPEETGVPSTEDMIKQLVEGHEAVIKTVHKAYKVAEEGKDEVSMSIMADRLTVHEKTAWMLRSMV